MTVLGLIFATTLPWALLHLFRTLYARYNPKRAHNSLPLPLLGGDHNASRSRGAWEIGPLWLKYETTRWNTAFTSLNFLSPFRARRRGSLESAPAGSSRLARWSVRLYTVGAGLCVLAMAAGMILLFWSALGLVWRIVHLIIGGDAGKPAERIVKRFLKREYLDEDVQSVDVTPERPQLHVLIPGITVPLSHLPILLCGLGLSGVIHEAGHAIAASLESVMVLSTGFHIHLVFPTFFVALSESTLASLPSPSRLRIATAGAWHNLITWGFLALFGFSVFSISDLYPLNPASSKDGLPTNDVCLPTSPASCTSSTPSKTYKDPSRLWFYFGYDNALPRGIVITHVESDSPLHGHLLPGSVVTRVDDLRLNGMNDRGFTSENAFKKWYTHLGMTSAQWARKVEEEPGWCVPERWFNQQSSACCHHSADKSTAHHHESEGPDSCFTSFEKTSEDKHKDEKFKGERCLDPVSLFTYQHSLGRGKFPKNPSIPNWNATDETQNKSGSGYGSRCHVACLRADGDNEEYVCARPQVHSDSSSGGGVDPAEERLLRLEIEDPPWLQEKSAPPSHSDSAESNEDPMRGRPPLPHEYRGNPNHRPDHVRPTRILVYKGPTSEILSHVSIGALQPRFRHLPLLLPHYVGTSLPTFFGLFWEYVARLSLSLAFFNLLPISGLDGGAVLSCLLEWWLGADGDANGAEEYDVELLERGASAPVRTERRGNTRQKEKIQKSASILTIVLGIAVAIATLWQDVG